MDRRAFMITGACLPGLAGGAWPRLAYGQARDDTAAVVDCTLAQGIALADYASHRQWPLFETGDDIGALWYTTLAPLLGARSARAPALLIGIARASDYFVLGELARRAGHRVESCDERRVDADALRSRPLSHVAFTIVPRVAD